MENFKFETEEQKRAFCLYLAVNHYHESLCDRSIQRLADQFLRFLEGERAGEILG